MYLWKSSDAFGVEQSPHHHHSVHKSGDDEDKHDHNHHCSTRPKRKHRGKRKRKRGRRRSGNVTGWQIGGRDVMTFGIFIVVLASSWILRALIVCRAYNVVVPYIFPMLPAISLGLSLALVGLIVLLFR